MAKIKGIRISDIEAAKAVIAHEAVTCFCGKEQEKSAQPKELVSCAGGAFWGKSGEQWPVSKDGEPLIPWLQIVCAEMNGLYGAFHNKKAVCFYIREEFCDAGALSKEDGSDFVVREYGVAETLVPLSRPEELKGHPFHQVVWERQLDYPSLSKYYSLFDKEVYQSLCEIKQFEFANRYGIKIGGWPTPVQRDQQYPGAYDLQIDITENFMYGDSGVGYLSRNGDKWHVMFECC